MNLRKNVLFPVFLLLGSSCFAADEPYCMQKSFSEYGNTKTCFKNINLPDQYFKQVCEPADNDEFTFQATYISSCPANYKGVCQGLKMQSGAPLPYLSYIYENDIPFMKKSCESNGGTWEEGDA